MVTRLKSCLVCVLAVAPLAWGALASPVVLRGSEWSSDLVKLFDFGLKNTPPAVAAARTQYEQLKRAKPTDPRIDYAYALVLAGQHKYRDALPLVSRYLERAPSDSDAKRVRIWLQIQDRRYPDVLTETVALSGPFPKNPTPEADDSYRETAHFLGMVFGYLELARPGSIDPKRMSQCKNQILARLGDKYIPAFDDGRRIVAEQLARMQAQREAEKQQAALAVEKRQEEVKAALEHNHSNITAQQEKAQSSLEQFAEAQRELSVIQQQLSTLNEDRTRLGAQIIAIQAQFGQFRWNAKIINQWGAVDLNLAPIPDSQIVPWPAKVTNQWGVVGPNLIAPPNVPLDEYARAKALWVSIGALNKQALDMDRKIVALQARGAALTTKGQQEAQAVARSEAVAGQSERHAKALEKQINRLKAAPASRSGVLTAKMTSLATYAPFPYEQEKQRVLDWFDE